MGVPWTRVISVAVPSMSGWVAIVSSSGEHTGVLTALPARLTAALGRHSDDLAEEDLQRAVDSQIPEGVDLD
jgi:hypothetical protein